MTRLCSKFTKEEPILLELDVPETTTLIFQEVDRILQSDNICIGGGYFRGLFMQQHLGLSPQMNDIDVFSDISVDDFQLIKNNLERLLGNPIRFHIGTFDHEEHPRGLIEFPLPLSAQHSCAGVKSIQINFGQNHPWANAYEYIQNANLGINQVAMGKDGYVISSRSFENDMSNQTMTMDKRRKWSHHDWDRTVKSMDRMIKERPEFFGWAMNKVLAPNKVATGELWQRLKLLENVPQ